MHEIDLFCRLMISSPFEYRKDEDIDDPQTTVRRRELIKNKKVLRNIYERWYADIIEGFKSVPDGIQVEIGSGGGFLKDIYPEIVTSDLLPLPFIDQVFSAEQFPYEHSTLSGICMVNVLHHIPQCRLFFKEAERCLKSGGKVMMVEPATTLWSKFIFKNFHHEPFEPKSDTWEIASTGPLSGANGALPWILFFRDRARFEKEFPGLRIKSIRIHTPFTYLLSGGVSRRAFLPDATFPLVYALERILSPLSGLFGMFMTIEIEKV